jgi:superfamily II DNA/RNA helicase
MAKGVYPPYTDDPYSIIGKPLFEEQYGNIFLFQDSNKSDYPRREDVLVKIIMTPEYLAEYTKLEDNIKGVNIKEGDEKSANAFMSKLRIASNKMSVCIKCDYVMKIIKRDEKTIFYSEFRSAGVDIIIDILKEKNIGYYLISGDIAMAKREKIVDGFNSPKGHNLLIITKAGGEGLDLKKVRNVILFEKGWNVSGDEQVIGRAVRYKSHHDLPEKDRLVTVYHILAVKPTCSNINKLVPEISEMKFNKIYTINKQYAAPSNQYTKPKSWKELGELCGADIYMLAQALDKQKQNLKLISELEKIQITSKGDTQPGEYDLSDF